MESEFQNQIHKNQTYNSPKSKAKWYTGVRKISSKYNGKQTTESILYSVRTKSAITKHAKSVTATADVSSWRVKWQNGINQRNTLGGIFHISPLINAS